MCVLSLRLPPVLQFNLSFGETLHTQQSHRANLSFHPSLQNYAERTAMKPYQETNCHSLSSGAGADITNAKCIHSHNNFDLQHRPSASSEVGLKGQRTVFVMKGIHLVIRNNKMATLRAVLPVPNFHPPLKRPELPEFVSPLCSTSV